MKNKVDSNKKINILLALKKILLALKKILLDEDNVTKEIPELEDIKPTGNKEEQLLDVLKKSQKSIEAKNFKENYKVVTHSKKKNIQQDQENVKKHKKENDREISD